MMALIGLVIIILGLLAPAAPRCNYPPARQINSLSTDILVPDGYMVYKDACGKYGVLAL